MNYQMLFFLYITIILSAVIHEYFHAWTADRLGDPTAKLAGRLTLNPLKHVDPFGTVILPLMLMLFAGIFIGYAKPVPFNPYNLKHKNGTLFVGLAGPASNLAVAIILGLVLRFALLPIAFAPFVSLIIYINIFLALFNMIPIPPLDGSKVIPELLPYKYRGMLEGSFIGIFLAIMIAFMIMPTVASFIYNLIVGHSFFM